MKKNASCLAALILAMALLSGCGLSNILPDVTTGHELPRMMVRSVEVAIHPRDPEFERHYVTQENLTALLNLLREIETTELTDEEPRLSDGQTYYTVTAVYASGETREYHLMGYKYLKVGDEPWCLISHEDAMTFTQFIRDHHSDDGSYVPPTTEPPPETTLPPEPTAAPTE